MATVRATSARPQRAHLAKSVHTEFRGAESPARPGVRLFLLSCVLIADVSRKRLSIGKENSASLHIRIKRSVRDAGEGVPALGGRKGGAPTSRGSAGNFLPGSSLPPPPDPLPAPRCQPRSLPGTSRLHSLEPPLSVGSPWRGCSWRGCSLEVASKVSSGSRAPGPRGGSPARRAAHWHSAHTAGRARCVSSRVVRLDDSGCRSPGRIPGPAAASHGQARTSCPRNR